MASKSMHYSLRLPPSLKAAVERLANAEGTSMNQFLVMAAAEKVAAIETAEAFFAARKMRGDKHAALLLLRDGGGEDPAEEDRKPTD